MAGRCSKSQGDFKQVTISTTTLLGGIALVAGNVTAACATKHPEVAFWAAIVASSASGLGLMAARDHKTSDEQAGANKPTS